MKKLLMLFVVAGFTLASQNVEARRCKKTKISYGAHGKKTSMKFCEGSKVTCNNSTFRKDPIRGVKKSCYKGTKHLAKEGESFTVPK
ncbi:MAG: hypothetical protein ACTSXL_02645 [Alphaproteobacteria bacterium]